jgi:hypothetical protein
MSGENDANEETGFENLIGSAIDEVNASTEASFGDADPDDTETGEEETKEEEAEGEDSEEESEEETKEDDKSTKEETTEEDDSEQEAEEQTEETPEKKPGRAQKRIQKLVEERDNIGRQFALQAQMNKQQEQRYTDLERRYQELEARIAAKAESEPPPGTTKIGDHYLPNELVEQFDDIDDPKTVKAILSLYDHVAPKQAPIGEDRVSELVNSNLEKERSLQLHQQQMREAEAKALKDYPHLFEDPSTIGGKIRFKENYVKEAQRLLTPFNKPRVNGQYAGNKLSDEPDGIFLVCRALSADKVALDAQRDAKERLLKAKKQKVPSTRSGSGATSKSSKEDQSFVDMLTKDWDKIKT